MELKYIIARNISNLRKQNGMTQLRLAEILNYSDKAVSKWESGASLPDIVVLKEIADVFGVTVDSLLSEEGKIEKTVHKSGRIHLVVTLLSVVLVWLIGTVIFVGLELAGIVKGVWLTFVWTVPVSLIVVLVFNSIWGKRRMNYLIISLLMWTLLLSIYLSLLKYNPWLLFATGIPGQIIIYLWSKLKHTEKPKKAYTEEKTEEE